MSDSDDENLNHLFEEPTDFYQPEKPVTYASHTLCSGEVLTLRLVGHNPLWGHHLWNAGRTVAHYIEQTPSTLIKGKSVLELGAGAGLPSLVCAIKGADRVVATDYPDADLIENLRHNITSCNLLSGSSIVAEGYLWGASTDSILAHLGESSRDHGFDLLILADLLFNHSEHGKLVSTIQKTLKKSSDAQCLVFFTPYRPWLFEKDLSFFDLAREHGYQVTKVFEKVMDKVMFENDPGDELLRRTVYGYQLQWNEVVPS